MTNKKIKLNCEICGELRIIPYDSVICNQCKKELEEPLKIQTKEVDNEAYIRLQAFAVKCGQLNDNSLRLWIINNLESGHSEKDIKDFLSPKTKETN